LAISSLYDSPGLLKQVGTLYRPDVDSLRALAILLVLIFHAFPEYLPGGFVGVDVFFVISGYLISTIIFNNLERDNFSYLQFYSRRIKRLFPALIITLAGCFILGWQVLFANEYRQLGKHMAASALFLSNITLWQEVGYFDHAAYTKPLLHLWSLAIEEQFYIFWPIFMVFIWKQKYNFFIVVLLIFSVSFSFNMFFVHTNSMAGFYFPLSRFWELMLGGLLAYIKLYKIRYFSRFGNLQTATGLILIAISALLLNKERSFPGLWALLPTCGTFLIIAADPSTWLNQKVLTNKILVGLGVISFPLYLIHWPLLSFAQIVEFSVPNWQTRLTICIVSIFLAWLVYAFVERPIRQGLHEKAKTFFLLCLILILGSLGGMTYQYNGFSFRFPKIMEKITHQEDYEYRSGYREGTCFLRPEQNENDFKIANCTTGHSKQKLIFLWGDSHAAHLYPGLQARKGKSNRIIQLTASACPPILEMIKDDRPHCKRINDFIFQQIQREKPDEIILSAFWIAYDWEKIDNTIRKLQQVGIKKIILVGTVPNWPTGLPNLMLKFIRKNRLTKIPNRLAIGLDTRIQDLDKKMLLYAKKAQINYVSPFHIFCNASGCLAKVKFRGIEELTAWDNAHLTYTASRVLVSHFPNKVLA
jgi:peptidoglycan/LPS O-acetylase OafA/YrhL